VIPPVAAETPEASAEDQTEVLPPAEDDQGQWGG
jgi:hypothetical protein